MADGDATQEKTEKPTPKKLQDARKEGQVVKSKELTSFFSIISIFVYFLFSYKDIVNSFSFIYLKIFDSIRQNFVFYDGFAQSVGLGKFLLAFALQILILPVIIAAVVSGFIAMIQVGGIQFSPKAMELKFDRFNVVTNAKNIVSMQNLKKFAKDIFQLTVMGCIGFYLIRSNLPDIINAAYYNIQINTYIFFKIMFELMLFLLIVYLIFAVLDYIIEYTSFMKKMMMSLEDLKREMKDTEVSQTVKQRQNEVRHENAQEDSMSNVVSKSTLVITNPTHIAIVIYYEPDVIQLPAVLLKAADHQAQLVKKLAKKYEVLIVEDVWLARQLYALAETKKYIPSSLIVHVADIIGKNIDNLPDHVRESFYRSPDAKRPAINPISSSGMDRVKRPLF